MNIVCPNCQKTLISSREVNKSLPLKQFGQSEIKCEHCGSLCGSTLKSRSIWFAVFLATLILSMLAGKQLVESAGYDSTASIIALLGVYFFVNWLFSNLWPRVIAIELKSNIKPIK